MRKLFTETQYNRLEEIAVAALNNQELPFLRYASEPVEFKDAPEDTLLVVVSPVLTHSGTWLSEGNLLRGSVIVKLSSESAKNFNYGDYSNMEKGYRMAFSEVSFFEESNDLIDKELTRKETYGSRYHYVKAKGLVIPVVDLIWDGYSIVGSSHFELTQDMCCHMPFNPIPSPESIRFDEISVVISDKSGRTWSKTFSAIATREDAIRWALASDGLHYHIKEISKIEIIEGTGDIN